MTKPTRINALSVAKMVRAFQEGACPISKLVDVSGLHIHTVREYVNALLKEGCIHLYAWDKDAMDRDNIRIYKWGRGVAAERTRKDKTQIMREVRARKKLKLLKTGKKIVSMSSTEANAISISAWLS